MLRPASARRIFEDVRRVSVGAVWGPPGERGIGAGRTGRRELDQHHRLAAHSADLTRISLRIQTLLRPEHTGKGQHLRAATTAYDQVLLLAATELGIAPDCRAPLPASERLGLEAELSLAGLRW